MNKFLFFCYDNKSNIGISAEQWILMGKFHILGFFIPRIFPILQHFCDLTTEPKSCGNDDFLYSRQARLSYEIVRWVKTIRFAVNQLAELS